MADSGIETCHGKLSGCVSPHWWYAFRPHGGRASPGLRLRRGTTSTIPIVITAASSPFRRFARAPRGRAAASQCGTMETSLPTGFGQRRTSSGKRLSPASTHGRHLGSCERQSETKPSRRLGHAEGTCERHPQTRRDRPEPLAQQLSGTSHMRSSPRGTAQITQSSTWIDGSAFGR